MKDLERSKKATGREGKKGRREERGKERLRMIMLKNKVVCKISGNYIVVHLGTFSF